MKKSFQLPLLLALTFAAPMSVSAASISDVYKQIDDLRAKAESDMAYVAKNGPNCTSHFDYLSEALLKTKAKVDAAQAALKSGFAKILAAPADGTCKAPDPKDIKLALKGIQAARDNLDFIVAQFDVPPSMFTKKTSHQVMLEAMAAAEGYPNCIPKNRNDPNSTPESQHYQSFHDGVIKLGKLLKQLDEDGGLKEAAKNACSQASNGRDRFASLVTSEDDSSSSDAL
ncbi:MAG: hypothetical protein ACXWQO_19500 [Bdellovibrionota bacterium]